MKLESYVYVKFDRPVGGRVRRDILEGNVWREPTAKKDLTNTCIQLGITPIGNLFSMDHEFLIADGDYTQEELLADPELAEEWHDVETGWSVVNPLIDSYSKRTDVYSVWRKHEFLVSIRDHLTEACPFGAKFHLAYNNAYF